LGTEAAKARLKAVGTELEVVSWVQKRPFTTLLVAAAAGGLAARVPRDRLLMFLDVLAEVVLSEYDTADKETIPQD